MEKFLHFLCTYIYFYYFIHHSLDNDRSTVETSYPSFAEFFFTRSILQKLMQQRTFLSVYLKSKTLHNAPYTQSKFPSASTTPSFLHTVAKTHTQTKAANIKTKTYCTKSTTAHTGTFKASIPNKLTCFFSSDSSLSASRSL